MIISFEITKRRLYPIENISLTLCPFFVGCVSNKLLLCYEISQPWNSFCVNNKYFTIYKNVDYFCVFASVSNICPLVKLVVKCLYCFSFLAWPLHENYLLCLLLPTVSYWLFLMSIVSNNKLLFLSIVCK